MVNTVNSYSMYGTSSLYTSGALSPINRTGALSSISSLTGTNTLYGFQSQFKRSTMQDAVEKATNFKSSADLLKSLISNFASSNSRLNESAAVSGNEDSIEINSGQQNSFVPSNPLEVQVDQVAKPQSNEGLSMGGGLGVIKSGGYGFAVDSAEGTRNYSINIRVTDDAKSIQQKMADAINKDSNSSVNARVEVDEENNTSRLVIEGKNTGETANGRSTDFTVRDTARAGERGLAETMGVTEVTQNAQNAVYFVDGERRESATNDVEIDKGLSATLKAPSSEPVEITAGKDADGAVSAAKEFVNSFNDLLKNANDAGGFKADRMANDLQSIVKSYKSTLEKAGISINSDGMLSADDDKLKAAAQDGSLNNLFDTQGSRSYGFANRLDQKASQISENPISFTNEAQLNNYYTQTGQNNYSAYSNMNAMYMSAMNWFL